MKHGGVITEAVTRGLNSAALLRDSGMPWLGHVPAHWEVKRLKFQAGDGRGSGIQIGPFGGMLTELTHADTGEFKLYGQENVLSGDFERGTRWLSAEQYADLGQYATEEGDFLFTRKGSIGGCAILPENARLGIIDSDTIRLRVNPRTLSTRFLLHAFREAEYLKFQIQLVKRGAILSGLNTMTIANLVLVAPPLDEQIAIATFLDWKTGQINALIARKRELIEKLKEKRLAVITQAITRGLDPAALLRDSSVPWLGDVPAHWEVRRLRFATSRIEQGWSPQCENQPADEGFWGVMKVGCVNGDAFDANENKALPPELDAAPEYELQAGDVLISRANTRELLGSAAIVPEGTRSKLLLCDKLYRVSPERRLKNDFLTFFLRTPIARFQYEREATGASSSMQNIAQTTIKNLPTVIPPFKEQEAICDHIRSNVAKIDTLLGAVETAIARLTEYSAALITAATTGKIDVRGIKIPHSTIATMPLTDQGYFEPGP